MAESVRDSPRRSSNRFQNLVDVFLKQSGLPFSDVLTAETIEVNFVESYGLLGIGVIYATANIRWALSGRFCKTEKWQPANPLLRVSSLCVGPALVDTGGK